MARVEETLRFYSRPTDVEPLPWDWVESALTAAPTYWLTGRTDGLPHPRPVWGVWLAEELFLSIGSPTLADQVAADSRLTVNLDSGTDVVIVEGRAIERATPSDVLDAYNAKYDWAYAVEDYGHLTRVAPTVVMGWRTAGFGGRDGWYAAGKWRFDR